MIDDMTTAEHLGRVCLRSLFFRYGTGEHGVISATRRERNLHLIGVRGYDQLGESRPNQSYKSTHRQLIPRSNGSHPTLNYLSTLFNLTQRAARSDLNHHRQRILSWYTMQSTILRLEEWNKV